MKFYICKRNHITLDNHYERSRCPICGAHAVPLDEKKYPKIRIDGMKMTPRRAMEYIKNRYGEEVI